MTARGVSPWKGEKYFVSPWNYMAEVQSGLAFPQNIKVHDATLRDGEQQAGIEFTANDKIKIAGLSAEAGVHRIEAGFPGVSAADYEAVSTIAQRNLPCDVFAFTRCLVNDVKMAVDGCGLWR